MTDGSLEVLFPDGKPVAAGGEKFVIMPFAFGQSLKAMRLLQPLLVSLVSSGLIGVSDDGALVFASDWHMRLLPALADGGDTAVQLCVLATGKDAGFIEALAMDEATDLIKAIFEVNADFFKKRMLPKLGVLLASAQTGSMPSIPSLQPDTAAPTSTDTP